ncbi:MAG: hypothetical protein NTV81_01805 [Candidatus Komeilibacteria bacterium]|nr:hypothetical protein [Candidatus Komeilibacteria bacterium]
MRNKKIPIFIVWLTLISWLLNFFLVSAQNLPSNLYEDNAGYNPNFIISDTELTNFNSWNNWEIQQFLLSKGGALAHYIDPLTNLKAAEVIYQTAQNYHINPKFLLVLIQKEQSLVEDPSPQPKQYDWATGYSCYNGQCSPSFQGFSAQVNAAADLFINHYLLDLSTTNCTVTNWCVGRPKTSQDGYIITPQNKVTAALLTYTPYRGGTFTNQGRVGANYNFWKIWTRWFGDPVAITFWPDGTLLKTQTSSTVYLIQDNTRRPIASAAVLKSRYNTKNVLTVSQGILDELPLGSTVKFSQYSLIQTPDQNIYLIVNDSKRLIVSPEAFRKLGFNPEEVEAADYADLAYLIDGPDLDYTTHYNLGALIKDPKSGGVYYVESSIKYPIPAPEIIKVNFPTLKTRVGTTKQLTSYQTGSAILFKDDTLVKTKDNPAFFVIKKL